jgi:dethiobiotin synthetase
VNAIRPHRLVVVVGTGTEIGKTWGGVRLLDEAVRRGLRCEARKPAQSFAPDDDPDATDRVLLARATGEDPDRVCPPHRNYPRAMAPPMAADALGLPRIDLATLIDELTWSTDTDLGLVETAGGVASPLAHDATSADLAHRLTPELVVLVADAGLGTINAVSLARTVLQPLHTVVLLNRFDVDDELHRRNRDWLTARNATIEVEPAALLDHLR